MSYYANQQILKDGQQRRIAAAQRFSERTQSRLRTQAREKSAAGILCTLCSIVYGAQWAQHPAGHRFLCGGCIERENARFLARPRPSELAGQPACYPEPVPEGAIYKVRLYNATGRGCRSVDCATPQEAQYTAMTERPFNNTGVEIWIAPPRIA